MKRTELRIGNLVSFPGYKENGFNYEPGAYPIGSIHGDNTIRLIGHNGDFGCFGINMVSPIPLSEEWLIRFGFEKCEAKDVWDKLKLTWEDDLWWIPGMYFFEKDSDTWKFYQATDEDTYWMIHFNVAYVHQLQNLYFALTGSELTERK